VSPRKINRISLGLLLLGLGGAGVIYIFAEPPVADTLMADPRADRKYKRELAMYGGKANVVSVEFMDWFGGLWQGRNLAGTVAVITVVATLGFRFVAAPPAGPAESPVPRDPA
jgi:hypothetical protein